MKICVLGAALDSDNMGVNVLAAGTLRCILARHPQGEIIFLNYGKSGFTFPFRAANLYTTVRFVNMRFSKKFYLKNNIATLILLALVLIIIPSRSLRRKLIAGNRCLREIDDCDVIASIAGGDSFSDIYGMERLLYVSLPKILVLLLRKKLVLLPQTIGPFKGRVAKAIARYILRYAELVYSRDHQGVRDAERLVGTHVKAGKLRFCYDVGFVVDPTQPADLGLVGLRATVGKKGSALVGLNVSGLLFMGGYNHKNMFGLRVEYEQFIYRLIEFLVQKKGATVLLVPHVFGDAGESDKPVCEKIYETLAPRYGDSVAFARGTYNQSEIKYIIGLCSFFIGARMHACIGAISQHVPTVPIAYSDKFIGVMQTVGIESNVIDPRKMGEEEMLSVVDRAFEQRMLTRQQLERKMVKVKEDVLTLFEDMERIQSPTCGASAGTVSVGV